MNSKILLLGILSLGFVQGIAQTFPLQIKDNKLNYLADDRENRILDFSYCGYHSSERPVPEVENVLFVSWKEGNQSSRIQKAINYVASLKPDKNGFRGAVLLDKGVFELNESLRINVSGVVLRGMDKNETILLKKGVDRGALLYVEGADNQLVTDTLSVISSYIPVNACTFEVSKETQLFKGDRIQIIRSSGKEWIASLGCETFGGGIKALGWKPGEIDVIWDRTIADVQSNRLTLDAPLTVSLNAKWGKTYVLRYNWPGRISEIGLENLTLESDYDRKYAKDEEHCWTGVSMENVENCWVRRVNFRHFAGSAVIIQQSASKITVEDCISIEPVSEIGGMRRTTFYTLGQQTLFQRCYSEQGIHDFAAGYGAAGPNAFVQCEAKGSMGFSGSVGSWACGLLFDIVDIDGNDLCFKNLGQDKNGAGWNTANSLFWQCTASGIDCYSPAEDAVNRAYGCWAQFSGNGEWGESNNHVRPRSFFYAQLNERLQRDCTSQARIMPLAAGTTSSPTVEQARKMAEEALEPRLLLKKWIDNAPALTINMDGLKSVDELKLKEMPQRSVSHCFNIQNGRLTMDGHLLVGGRHEVPWWNGNLRRPVLAKAKLHVTRFVPGMEGMGLTDRIDSVVNNMVDNKILVLDHNYGLWYERRRDDHERIRRRDGDVWGPFYEQPFARSGKGLAWDGLSKYDLNRPNTWYWSRLKEFAEKGAEKGLLLYHENFHQHNILEAGAHWVDSPWRTANNINETDFPEPVNFTGDKRLFMADRFYDVNHAARCALYKQYIRQCLENFADNSNVIQFVSTEYTGPLHFVQFWLDVIGEWEKETGKKATVALSATKDVQDAILNDTQRAKLVDIIDIRYWHYKVDGLYAPEGGKNLAPRQHARKMKVGKVTFDEAYRAVSEYRKKFPEKAVTYYAQNYPDMAWAVFMASGSCPVVPVSDESFLTDAAAMDMEDTGTNKYQKLVKSGIGSIIYSHSATDIPVHLSPGKYILKSVDPKTGAITVIAKRLNIKDVYMLKAEENKDCIYWFHRI